MRLPDLPPIGAAAPRRWGAVSSLLGRTVMALLGFRFDGAVPDVPRCVVVVAPHTSNWDFLIGMAAMLAVRLDLSWIGKSTIFVGPLGWLWRALGGVPVDRRDPAGAVEQIAATLRARPRMFVGLAPEGTRKKVERWKSGFHRMAVAAEVPLWPLALDWSARLVRMYPLYVPTGDFDTDVAALRTRFDAKMARNPEQY